MPEFRRVTTADLDELISMMRALFAQDGIPFDDGAARQGLALAMSPSCAVHETARVWLILDESETAGYIALTFAFSFEFGGWYGFIDELYLREPFRRRGWGTQAVELAASTCRELGMRALLLEADVGNQAATRLYRRLGFIEHRRRLMRRTL